MFSGWSDLRDRPALLTLVSLGAKPISAKGPTLRSRIFIPALIIGIAACQTDDVRTIRSLDGEVSLVYRCASIEPQARTPGERQAVRQNAGRILRYEVESQGEGSGAIVQALREALILEDDDRLELAVAQFACTNDIAVTRIPRFPEPGSVPPAFAASVLDEDRVVDLREERGSIVVLNFWATWCVPCIREYPELVALSEVYRDSGVAVYGILHRDRPAAARGWIADHPGPVETLLDPDGAIARSYRVSGIPHTFIVGRSGNLVASWSGYSPGQLEERIVQALAE
jgi:peroxiredoxin